MGSRLNEMSRSWKLEHAPHLLEEKTMVITEDDYLGVCGDVKVYVCPNCFEARIAKTDKKCYCCKTTYDWSRV